MVLHCIRLTAIIYVIAAMVGLVLSIVILGQGILTNFALIQIPGLYFRITLFIFFGSAFLITFTRYYLTRHLKLTSTEAERHLGRSNCPQFISSTCKITSAIGCFLFMLLIYPAVFDWLPNVFDWMPTATKTHIPPLAVSSFGLIIFSGILQEIFPLTRLQPLEKDN